jgi:hypothetical protein
MKNGLKNTIKETLKDAKKSNKNCLISFSPRINSQANEKTITMSGEHNG